jgi:molecular chaperone HscB
VPDEPSPIPDDLDHFAVLGVPRKLGLDDADLNRRFLALSREHHPDRFAGRDPAAVAVAQRNAARVNDAYRTLRDPIRRVEYLLDLAGVTRPEGEAKCPPDLLEEVFDLRERQMEGEDVAAEVGAHLEAADADVAALFAEHDAALDGAAADEAAARAVLDRLRAALDRRKFLAGLAAEVRGR